MNSVGGMISSSKLRQSGSLKNLGLYSVSVGLEGHDPESEVILLSFFLGVNIPGSFLGLDFPSLVGFFHGLNFSVCFSMSSTKVWVTSLSLDLCHKKYGIFWKVTGKETIFKIASGIQRSCHAFYNI